MDEAAPDNVEIKQALIGAILLRNECYRKAASYRPSGTWVRYNNAGGWQQFHTAPSAGLAAGDLDGDGRDELLADRGVSGALGALQQFRRMGAASHPLALQHVAADLDNSGKFEVITDRGSVASGLATTTPGRGGSSRPGGRRPSSRQGSTELSRLVPSSAYQNRPLELVTSPEIAANAVSASEIADHTIDSGEIVNK